MLQVSGLRLGRAGDDIVTLTLRTLRGSAFASPPCVFEVDQLRVRCTSPPGVGRVVSLSIAVGGVPSNSHPTVGLTFTAPVVLAITADTGSTAGGVVRISGRNFGPASLNAVDAVTYAPAGFPIDPRPARCAVSVDDIELTCVTSGGVGAQVRVNCPSLCQVTLLTFPQRSFASVYLIVVLPSLVQPELGRCCGL
jgi:hypothetical protein